MGDEAGEQAYYSWVFASALFAPFEDIPALADIADGPIEWAVMGVRRSWNTFGDLSGHFDYDLYVECPTQGCQNLVDNPRDLARNCDLPPAW